MSQIKLGHNFQDGEPTVLNSTLVKIKSYFNELVTAAKWMNTTYTIYFEPDVWFQNNITKIDYPKGIYYSYDYYYFYYSFCTK